MKTYLTNAFSLSMLDGQVFTPGPCELDIYKRRIEFARADAHEARDAGEIVSCVGHEDVARLMSDLLGMEVPVNRVSIKLEPGDELLVGQYVGPRLPEGATQLPEGAKIEWYRVQVRSRRD